MYLSFLISMFYLNRIAGGSDKGRSVETDVSSNMFKVMNAVIIEAHGHLTELDRRDPEVAVVSAHDQPEFMHNLMFR